MGKKQQKDYLKYLSSEELSWMHTYEKMSDEEIYQMIRDKASELGKIPSKADIPGAGFLKIRFGPWPRLLEAAGVKEVSATRMRRLGIKKKMET